MPSNPFRNLTGTLARLAPRRETLKTLAALGGAALGSRLAVADSEAKKKCRKRQQKCGGEKKCCGRQSGLVACRQFPSTECPSLSGRRCAGLESAPCDRANGNCDCAPGFRCVAVDVGANAGTCQETPI
jgi:hypothetical protein